MRPGTVSSLFNFWPWHRAQGLDLGEHLLVEGRTDSPPACGHRCPWALDSSCELGRKAAVFLCGVLIDTQDVNSVQLQSIDMDESMLELGAGIRAGCSCSQLGRGCWGEGSRVRGPKRLRGECPCSIKVKGIRFVILNWHMIESLGFRPAVFPGVAIDAPLCQEYLLFVQLPPKNSLPPTSVIPPVIILLRCFTSLGYICMCNLKNICCYL